MQRVRTGAAAPLNPVPAKHFDHWPLEEKAIYRFMRWLQNTLLEQQQRLSVETSLMWTKDLLCYFDAGTHDDASNAVALPPSFPDPFRNPFL